MDKEKEENLEEELNEHPCPPSESTPKHRKRRRKRRKPKADGKPRAAAKKSKPKKEKERHPGVAYLPTTFEKPKKEKEAKPKPKKEKKPQSKSNFKTGKWAKLPSMLRTAVGLEEESSMASGAVEGAPGKRNKFPTIFREEEEVNEQKDFIEEMILREILFRALKQQHYEQINLVEQKKQQEKNDEPRLRQVIKQLIQEAKKDVEDTPHSSTAINILEDLLKQILPNLEIEYKTLTTAKEQRDSFRAHVVSAVSTLLETEDINKAGGAGAEEEGLISLEEDDMEEEVSVKISDVDAPADDKFIDIENDTEAPEEEDAFGIEGQDETGRALSQEAFNNIEKNISETYAILHDEEDEKLFKDYLITNLKLYFDKWEQELGPVTEPTTDEYEAEKDEDDAGAEAGAEFDAELGGELGGEAPGAAGASEEVI